MRQAMPSRGHSSFQKMTFTDGQQRDGTSVFMARKWILPHSLWQGCSPAHTLIFVCSHLTWTGLGGEKGGSLRERQEG